MSSFVVVVFFGFWFLGCFFFTDTKQVSYDSQAEVLSISSDMCFMEDLSVTKH